MTLQSLLFLALQASIFLTVLTIGMKTSSDELRYLLSKPSRLVRALLAMNVIAPVIAIAICKVFSLHPAEIVALVTLSIAPVSNMFPKSMLPLLAPNRAAYARGLFFASTVLSMVLTPLTVDVIGAVFGQDQHVSPLLVARVVIGTMVAGGDAVGPCDTEGERSRAPGLCRRHHRGNLVAHGLPVSRGHDHCNRADLASGTAGRSPARRPR